MVGVAVGVGVGEAVGVDVRVGAGVGVGVEVRVGVGVGISAGEIAMAPSTSVWIDDWAYSLKFCYGLYRSGKPRGKFMPMKGSMASKLSA